MSIKAESLKKPRKKSDLPAPRYNRKQTETEILDAVGRVLARDSFINLTINAIAREANVNKVLIYRYFGGMPQLLQAFGSHGGFWPSAEELFKDVDLQALSFERRLQLFFEHMIDALRRRPLTLEILAMEVGTPNALTEILSEAREQWGRTVEQRLVAGYHGDIQNLNITVTMLFAGIQYLLLRTRDADIFSGIPIREDAGWDAIKQSLSWLCTRIISNDDALS